MALEYEIRHALQPAAPKKKKKPKLDVIIPVLPIFSAASVCASVSSRSSGYSGRIPGIMSVEEWQDENSELRRQLRDKDIQCVRMHELERDNSEKKGQLEALEQYNKRLLDRIPAEKHTAEQSSQCEHESFLAYERQTSELFDQVEVLKAKCFHLEKVITVLTCELDTKNSSLEQLNSSQEEMLISLLSATFEKTGIEEILKVKLQEIQDLQEKQKIIEQDNARLRAEARRVKRWGKAWKQQALTQKLHIPMVEQETQYEYDEPIDAHVDEVVTSTSSMMTQCVSSSSASGALIFSSPPQCIQNRRQDMTDSCTQHEDTRISVETMTDEDVVIAELREKVLKLENERLEQNTILSSKDTENQSLRDEIQELVAKINAMEVDLHQKEALLKELKQTKEALEMHGQSTISVQSIEREKELLDKISLLEKILEQEREERRQTLDELVRLFTLSEENEKINKQMDERLTSNQGVRRKWIISS
jgi:hypothetical protein